MRIFIRQRVKVVEGLKGVEGRFGLWIQVAKPAAAEHVICPVEESL